MGAKHVVGLNEPTRQPTEEEKKIRIPIRRLHTTHIDDFLCAVPSVCKTRSLSAVLMEARNFFNMFLRQIKHHNVLLLLMLLLLLLLKIPNGERCVKTGQICSR
jgi:hypothetical protein